LLYIASQEELILQVAQTIRASVVIPVRNRPDLLQRTLETLVAQDLAPAEYEIIVCDDGSSDDIETLVRQFQTGPVQVRFEKQLPAGPAAARNLGIRASASAILIFFDSDVLIDASAARLLLAALDSHPEWKGAEAALHPIGEEFGVLWDAPSSLEGGRYHTAAIAYRRNVLLKVGGFDEQFTLPACEDVELAIRVLSYGPIGFVPQAIVCHPMRRITWTTHWRWRRHWQFETILALRYGIMAFPGKRSGKFPRLRIALSALITLPAGRLLTALKSAGAAPKDAFIASFLALFDVACGLSALPTILLHPLPTRRHYLSVIDPRLQDRAIP